MHARCVALNANSVGPAAGGPMTPLAKGRAYASHAKLFDSPSGPHRIHVRLARWQCSPNAIVMHGTTHRKNT